MTNVMTHQLSDCGYDHTARKSKMRRNAVPFTGCLAHAEIMYAPATGNVLLIRGVFEHNVGCNNVFYARIPPRALHPSVYATALKQLSMGAQLSDIQAKNNTLYQQRAYEGQTDDHDEVRYRYRFLNKLGLRLGDRSDSRNNSDQEPSLAYPTLQLSLSLMSCIHPPTI